MNSLPWYKRDVDAWRGGTRGMSLELRGFYSELLDAMWDRQAPLPRDEKHLAMMVCCNVRTVRKLLPQLIAIGKVVETPEGLTNNRMASEIALTQGSNRKPNSVIGKPNSVCDGAEFELSSSPIRAEFASRIPKNPMFSTRVLEEEEEERKKEKEEQLSHPPTEQAAVCVCDEDIRFKSVLEVALHAMVEDAQRWIGNGITQAGARHWIAGLCETYGRAAVAKGYHHTVKGFAQGSVRNPANYWPATAERFARGVQTIPIPKLTAREALRQLEAEGHV